MSAGRRWTVRFATARARFARRVQRASPAAMRNGFRLVALVVLGSMASPACGGSSSETPFPIEPNQAELRSGMLTRPHTPPPKRKKRAGPESAEEPEEE